MAQMRRRMIVPAFLAIVSAFVTIAAAAQSDQQDFLSPAEADKVRDAPTPSERVRLFLEFASDRLKKLQYELGLKEVVQDRDELLNGLLNGYSGCMDEAAERIDDGRKSGADMRVAIKAMQKEAKENLDILQKVKAAGGPDLDVIKDRLDDAIEGTQDALNDANKAAKEYGAVPVRRKP